MPPVEAEKEPRPIKLQSVHINNMMKRFGHDNLNNRIMNIISIKGNTKIMQVESR